jgi:hypothetical protein
VWANTQLYGEVEAEDMALERELVAVSAAILEANLAGLSAERAATVGRLIVQTIGGSLFSTLRLADDATRDRVIAELKVMLRAYLAALTAPAG